MDFRFTKEDEEFRQEILDWLAKELPPDWIGHRAFDVSTEEEDAFADQFVKNLAVKGWLTMAWPKEYGGLGWPIIRQLIYNEEMAYARAPMRGTMGISWVAPSIMLFGTEEQKREYLPKIRNHEVVWCTLYSEPDAGSDLASVKLRAVEEGDEYILNGQKIWTSEAHYSQWGWCIANTDPEGPKHRNLSMFLVDMSTPGITVRPLINLLGAHHFNEVFLDDVHVPKKNMVGDKNRGWFVLMAALEWERSGVGQFVALRHTLEELIEYAKVTKRNDEPLAKNPVVRQKLAQMAIEIEQGRTYAYRIAWLQSKGLQYGTEASVSKLYGGELMQRLSRIGMEILGLYGPLKYDSKWTALQGRITSSCLSNINQTIWGGTSEVQRNIIGTRGLGLPRSF